MLRFRSRADETGFTLVELMVTLALFALLTAIAVPVFITQSKAIAANNVRQDVHSLATSVRTALLANPNATGFTIYTGNTPPAVGAGVVPVRNTTQSSNTLKIIGPVQCNSNPVTTNTSGTAAGYSVVGYSTSLNGYYYWYNSVTGDFYSSESWTESTQSCKPDNSFKSK